MTVGVGAGSRGLYSPSRTILLGSKIQIEGLGNESRSTKQAIQIFNPAFLSSVFSFWLPRYSLLRAL